MIVVFLCEAVRSQFDKHVEQQTSHANAYVLNARMQVGRCVCVFKSCLICVPAAATRPSGSFGIVCLA